MQRLKSEIVQWMHSKRRVINMLVGLSAVLIYEVVRVYYRPYIYSNAINDFHIADTLGNSLGTIATVFVFVSLLGRNSAQDHFLIGSVTISLLVYELAHPLLGKPIDSWDMLAMVIAGVFCVGLYRLLHGHAQSVHSKSDITL